MNGVVGRTGKNTPAKPSPRLVQPSSRKSFWRIMRGAVPRCDAISANLLAKVSPVRDPNAKNAKGAKKGLSIYSRPLVSSSGWFRTTR